MLIRILPILLLFIFACGGPSDDGNLDVTPNDTLSDQGGTNEERLTAVEVNNELALIMSDLSAVIFDLFTCEISLIEQKHQDALFEIDLKIDRLNNIKLDGSENEFVSAVEALALFYQDELNGEFSELMPVMIDTNRTDQDIQRLESYDVQFALIEEEFVNKIYAAQNNFAATNNINLEGQ